MTALDVRELSVNYGPVLALDNVTLAVSPGTITGLVGVNGSGKSTLLRAIIGAVRPDSGTIHVLGYPANEARRRGLIAYLPQAQDIDTDFPIDVASIVAMGRYGRLGASRRLRGEDKDAVGQALKQVGLSELANRQIGRLSGGQRQRVFLARAIAQKAAVLLLDEPLAAIDQANTQLITGLLRGLAETGVTIVVATHDLVGLPALVDQAVVLQRCIAWQGAPEHLLDPKNLALAFGSQAPRSAPPPQESMESQVPRVSLVPRVSQEPAPATQAPRERGGAHELG